jgi:hypothetical protein
MKVKSQIKDPEDPRLDKFYDETPEIYFVYKLKLSRSSNILEFPYSVRLDGATDEDNKELIEQLDKRAQADMDRALRNAQADDDEVEFEYWEKCDKFDVVISHSDTLTVYVKPQVGTVSK